MKIRNGFVSNSSSQCFILDYRKDSVKELLTHLSANLPRGDRCTAIAIGGEAVDYANSYDMCSSALSDWILRWAEQLGENNVVFLRESDEGMGGYLFGKECPDDWLEEVPKPKEGVVYGWYDKNNTLPDEEASRRVFEVAEDSMENH